jgi:hypothetical protein
MRNRSIKKADARTLPGVMSALGQKRTSLTLFDHLIGALLQPQWQ